MSVRRLTDQQPSSFEFNQDNLAWANAQLTKYPAGRQASAVIPLLWRAQEQHDYWLPKPAIEKVADMLGMPYIRVLEVATFYTMFNLAPVGKYFIQMCGTTPCMLRGSNDIKAVLEKRIGEQSHVTPDGKFSWLEVECLGACCNAPMVQINNDYYEDLSPENFNKLLDDLAAGRPVQKGSQTGRKTSEPTPGKITALASFYPEAADNDQIAKNVAADAIASAKRAEAAAAALAASAAAPDAPAPVSAPAASAPAPIPAAVPVAAPPAPKPIVPAPVMAAPVAAPAADAAPVSDDHKPTLLAAARSGAADDLKLIWGVGPKLETMLHDMGIFHFDQIAAWTEMNLRWVDQNLKTFKGRALRDKWIEQSKKLATGWRPDNSVGDKPV